MEILLQADAWVALITLTFLEIVLGIDNIVFISIISNKLEKTERAKSRNIGLLLAMLFRILLLFAITWVLKLQKVLLSVDFSWLEASVTGQSIIIFLGGLFLLYKSVTEIHHKLESNEDHLNNATKKTTLFNAILQITLLNVVFSFDSILTAIGLVDLNSPPVGFGFWGGMVLMILAVIISVIVMLLFSGVVSRFVNKHPSVQLLGLSFLMLIAVMLIAESSHLAHVTLAGQEVHSIPKGYIYFAIFFSLFVEFLNIKFKKTTKPVQLHNNKIIK